MTTAALVEVRNGKCSSCGTFVSTDDPFAWYEVKCPNCGTLVGVKLVTASYGNRNCGEHCTEGTGRRCTCTCGGGNHGLAWRVK